MNQILKNSICSVNLSLKQIPKTKRNIAVFVIFSKIGLEIFMEKLKHILNLFFYFDFCR